MPRRRSCKSSLPGQPHAERPTKWCQRRDPRKRSPDPCLRRVGLGERTLRICAVSHVDARRASDYPFGVDYRDIITIEPGKRGGKPCIRGLRITVTDILEYLASGMSAEEILADFPDLTAEDVRACLAFAADRERRLWVVPAA